MIPEPDVLDDLCQHRAFTIHATSLDVENVVIEAWRLGAKAFADLCLSQFSDDWWVLTGDEITELREQVDE